MNINIKKTSTYKGHTMEMIEDKFHINHFFLDKNYEYSYASFMDCKRVINGEKPILALKFTKSEFDLYFNR